MLDVPLYGRIATIELFRPHVSYFPVPSIFVLVFFLETKLIINFVSSQNETQDFLFIATERYKFCVLQWDAEKSELLTRFEHFTLLATVSQIP
jgi:DNA damage-binding protein 1